MLSCIIASQNLKKRNELQQLLPSSFTFLLPSEIGFFDSIAETENSFEGNARLKAQAMQNFALSKKLNASIIADDSGLEVEALNGAPGVYSARFAGENANDAENVQLLLLKLKGVTRRKARFVSVIVFQNQHHIQVFKGEVQGTIAYQSRGTNGFGYDSVFIPTGYRSTFAELSSEHKNLISHRAKAMAYLVNYIKLNNTKQQGL